MFYNIAGEADSGQHFWSSIFNHKRFQETFIDLFVWGFFCFFYFQTNIKELSVYTQILLSLNYTSDYKYQIMEHAK